MQTSNVYIMWSSPMATTLEGLGCPHNIYVPGPSSTFVEIDFLKVYNSVRDATWQTN